MDQISLFALRDLIGLFYCGNLHESSSLCTKEPLKEDLNLIAKVSNLIFRNPRSFPTSKNRRGLRRCCWHAKQWVFDSTKSIGPSDPTVTYACVKETLNSFMASHQFIRLTDEASHQFIRLTDEDIFYYQDNLPASLLDHVQQLKLEQASNLLVLLYNCANLVEFKDYRRSLCQLSNLIFRRPGWKRNQTYSYNLSTCFKFGRLFLSRSTELIPSAGALSYDYVYDTLRQIGGFLLIKSPQELPGLEPKPAVDGSKVTHHRRLKLDRGRSICRIGSDKSRSGLDVSPICTPPLPGQTEMVDRYCNQILSGEIKEDVELEYVEQLHILLESDSSLAKSIPEELVTYLMEFLVYDEGILYLIHEYQEAQWHTVSIICNAVHSLKIREETRQNVIQSLLKLIKSDCIYVQAEALYGLARLSKFDRYRSRILELGALEVLVEVVKQGISAIFPDSALLLSVICFTERNIPVNEEAAALQIIKELVTRGSYRVKNQAFSALAYLSDGRYVAIESACCERLMLFISGAWDLVAPSALEVVGNIVRWGKVDQITIMIKNGILVHLRELLSHEFIMVRKEACWIISNITVGSELYLKDLCEVNLLDSLCTLLEVDDLDLRMEAVWAIFNSILYGDDDHEQITYPNRSSTHPYILGGTRKIDPEPSLRIMVVRWRDVEDEDEDEDD